MFFSCHQSADAAWSKEADSKVLVHFFLEQGQKSQKFQKEKRELCDKKIGTGEVWRQSAPPRNYCG
jgi:hypothetical protein